MNAILTTPASVVITEPVINSAIELIAVSKSFGKTEIIRGASLQIEQGQRYALIGPNGAGKSTLFNLISGRFPVSRGDILLNGVSIVGRKPYQINRLGLSRSFQITNIFHRLSVFENLRCAVLWSLGYRYSFWHRLNGLKDANERADKILEEIGLQVRRNVEAGLLSYAEQRALEIGITIAGGADVILLDEPTAGMSRSEAEAAVELIRKVTIGKTLLMVEHDMSVVFDLADRVAVLVYGEVIACDTPAEIRNNEQVQQAYLGSAVHSEDVA
jgi:branched-chain amino acid transport system ATP-binding protein